MAVIKMNFFSSALKRNTEIAAIIPSDSPCKTPCMKKWDSVFLLHGTYGDASDWIRYSNVECYAQECGVAVIMVSCGNNFFRDMVYGEAYETFLTKELPDYVEYMFPIQGGPEHMSVGGLSMGGYGAFSLAVRHPEVFGKVFSLSGGFDFTRIKLSEDFSMEVWPFYSIFGEEHSDRLWGRRDVNLKPQIRELKESGSKFPAVFQSVGTEDFTLEINREMDRFLTEQDIDHVYREVPGGHDWKLWNAELAQAMNWLVSVK